MFFKNKNIKSIILLIISSVVMFGVYLNNVITYNNSFYLFKSYILEKYPNANINIKNNQLIIKSNEKSKYILSLLLKLNVKIEFVYYKENTLVVFCKPEGNKPMIVFQFNEQYNKENIEKKTPDKKKIYNKSDKNKERKLENISIKKRNKVTAFYKKQTIRDDSL